MATERVIVMDSVAEDFLKELKYAAEGFPAGTAVTLQGATRTETLVDSAIKQGAKLEFGQVSRENASLHPTIMSGVSEDMEFFYTESFGPTISVMTARTADEAVALANDTEYSLTASIFSHKVPKAIKLARRIESGACHINAMTIHDEPWLPHGGAKASSFGRFGSQWGMDEFLQVRMVTVLDD